MNLNIVHVAGRLTRDPVLRYTPSQTAVCEFCIATSERFKSGNEWKEVTTFVDCTAWAHSAEFINKFFAKGKEIFVTGRLRYETWDDKTTGKKRSKLTVTVSDAQFVGPKDSPQSADADQDGNVQTGAGATGSGGEKFSESDVPY